MRSSIFGGLQHQPGVIRSPELPMSNSALSALLLTAATFLCSLPTQAEADTWTTGCDMGDGTMQRFSPFHSNPLSPCNAAGEQALSVQTEVPGIKFAKRKLTLTAPGSGLLRSLPPSSFTWIPIPARARFRSSARVAPLCSPRLSNSPSPKPGTSRSSCRLANSPSLPARPSVSTTFGSSTPRPAASVQVFFV
jgi:hypothetical protein